MEQIVIQTTVTTIITAIAILIGLFVTEILYGKRIFGKLEKHDDGTGSHYQKLSREHMELKNDSNNILEVNKEIKTKLYDVDIFLKTEKENKKIQFDNLSDKQKEMKSSIDKLAEFSEEFQRISLLNSKLLHEVNSLQYENEQLKIQNRRLRDGVDDLEQDEQYEY